RLGGNRVEPCAAVVARDGDDRAVGARDDRGSGREAALLDRGVARVLDDAGVVCDDALTGEEGIHHCSLASRADACEASSPPTAAMSHAHSRCPSTRPYMRLADAYCLALAERTTASVARSMRGPEISPR